MQAERILRRYWQESGAAAFFKYASDPNVEPCAGWPARRLVEKSCEIIQTFFPNGTVWTIVLEVTGEPIGCRCN